MVKNIHFLDTFPFSYDVCKSVNINANFPKPGYNIDDFKAGAIVVVEFYILLRNFKASNKVDVIKAYSFWLLEVYLIHNPMYSMISILNKRQRGKEE